MGISIESSVKSAAKITRWMNEWMNNSFESEWRFDGNQWSRWREWMNRSSAAVNGAIGYLDNECDELAIIHGNRRVGNGTAIAALNKDNGADVAGWRRKRRRKRRRKERKICRVGGVTWGLEGRKRKRRKSEREIEETKAVNNRREKR